VIARAFEETVRRKVQRTGDPIVRHPEKDWLLASLDFETEDGQAVVECKAVNPYHLDDWGEPGTDQVPDHYLLQTQHQLAVTGRATAYLAMLIGGENFRVYVIERNDQAIESLLAIEADFWQRVLLRDPPEPSWQHRSTSKLIARLYGLDESLAVTMGEDVLDLVRRYEEVGEVASANKEARESLKAQLLFLMGEAGFAYLPDGLSLTRKQVTRKAYEVKETSYIDFRIRKGKVRA
jgi:predicted phage-related endonuclease